MMVSDGQQNGLRAETLATPLIGGFQRACKILDENRENEASHLKGLRDSLLNGLEKELVVEVVGDIDDRHPGNLYLAIDGVDSMQLLNNLQPKLAFSLGSACDGLNRKYPPLLKAMQISKEKAESSFRICVGRMTTIEEIELSVSLIIKAVKKMAINNNLFYNLYLRI